MGRRRRLGGRHETLKAETRERPRGGFSHEEEIRKIIGDQKMQELGGGLCQDGAELARSIPLLAP